MSPHQRELSFDASAVKSRRIASARAAAAGSAMVVFFHRLAARLHQPCHTLAAVPAQLRVHPRGAVTALRFVMHGPDLPGELGVAALVPRRAGQVLVEGGAGDLQQRARPRGVAPVSLLRLDEQIAVHRVSLAKKAVARLRISTSSRSLRFSRRRSASSRRSSVVKPPSWRVPASRSACLTHSRTAFSFRSTPPNTLPTQPLPTLFRSTPPLLRLR